MPTNTCAMCIPKVVLVPLLCFDIRKHRLGYGGGYYDATIKHFRQLNYPTKFVGIGLEAVKTKELLPSTLLDEPLDYIVTESNIIY
jgi:5-formyltetrahydrofolate cyclo-ligase